MSVPASSRGSRASRTASSSASAAAAEPTRGQRARERFKRYGRNYGAAAKRARSAGRAVTQAAPGTDTFGDVFKMLSIAGLIGLGVTHPQMVRNALDAATRVIRTVVTGKTT